MIQNTNYGASKSYVDAALSNTYTKTETDTLLAGYVTLNTAQTIPAVKTLLKSKDLLPATIKLNDYAAGDSANAYLDGMIDENNTWVRAESVGTDLGGARGYYSKTISVSVSGAAHTIERRWWLTAADGFTESYLDPIKSAWRNVVTDDILDTYAQMVRTVNNQRIRGIKTHVIEDINTGILRIETPTSTSGVLGVAFDFYEDTLRVGYMYIRKNADNSYQLVLGTRNSDATFTERAL